MHCKKLLLLLAVPFCTIAMHKPSKRTKRPKNTSSLMSLALAASQQEHLAVPSSNVLAKVRAPKALPRFVLAQSEIEPDNPTPHKVFSLVPDTLKKFKHDHDKEIEPMPSIAALVYHDGSNPNQGNTPLAPLPVHLINEEILANETDQEDNFLVLSASTPTTKQSPMILENNYAKKRKEDSESESLSIQKKPRNRQSSNQADQPLSSNTTQAHLLKPRELHADSPKYFANEQTKIMPLSAAPLDMTIVTPASKPKATAKKRFGSNYLQRKGDELLKSIATITNPGHERAKDTMIFTANDRKNQETSLALSQAIAAKNYDKVRQLLLNNPAAVNSPDYLDLTPLMHAINNNDIDMMNLLCRQGADINGTSSAGVTPLQFSCDCGAHPEVIRSLLNAGANITLADKDGKTALINAIVNAHDANAVKVVKLLLSHSQSSFTIAHQDKAGKTAFDYAQAKKSSHLKKELIHLLDNQLGKAVLEKIIHPDKITYKGWTALMLAAEHNNRQAAQLLIDAGADVNHTHLERSPLDMAVMNGHSHMVKFLLDAGARIDTLHGDYLKYAIADDHTHVVATLLEKDAKKIIHREDDEGILPLFTAIDSKNDYILQLLISHGADVNHPSSLDGYTALHWVCIYPNLRKAHLVLSYGAKPNAADHVGQTPLFYAVKGTTMDTVAVVNLLLAQGAHVNHTNLEGKTALDYVQQREESEIKTQLIKVLKKYGAH